MFQRSAAILSLLFVLNSPAVAQAPAPRSAPMHGAWGIDLSDQDRAVRPGDDFAMYQNGGWFRRTELKPGQAVSAYWRDVRVEGTTRIDDMMATLDNGSAANQDRVEALLAAFHRSADEQVVNGKGLAPLRPALDAIRSAKDKRQFARLMGAIEGPGTLRYVQSRLIPGRSFYGVNIVQDQIDPAHYAIYINQAGLILPGREYYLDPAFKDLKATYQAAMAKMLRHIGWADPDRKAEQVVALETRIATASSTHEELRNSANTYHRVTLAQLRRQAPGVDWQAFFRGAELPSDARIAVDVPQAIGGIAKIYAKAPLDVLQAKEAFGAAIVNAVRLDAPTYQIYKDFADTVLPGILASPTYKLEITNLIEDSVGDAISAAYVKRYFSPEVKTKVLAMSLLMKDALDRRVLHSSWLSPEGKSLAHAKVSAMEISVGYPVRLDDYRGLVIKDDDLFGNASRAAAYRWRKQVALLKGPVDRSKWSLVPFYAQIPAYTPTTNSLIIPAAMLVPPFFDINADDAVNYGAIGTIIGSQIAGAVTMPGIDYDGSGRLGPWLPAADRAHFDSARKKISALYSREEPLPGLRLKGDVLINESMPDILGTQIALDAYHASLNGADAPVLDGLTGDQRFFLGRAQSWRAKFSPTVLRNQIATGSNTPPYFRLNGPLPNVDEWYGAFGVQPSDKLYLPPEERVRIW
ncbi:M13-type metalloendopeptidase [Sphingomonas sp.]|uniref:M13-type metalloendopeptidase n=1 Tax=Sphingomonas sp. TaxID=28214 RepID=UPI0038A50ADE